MFREQIVVEKPAVYQPVDVTIEIPVPPEFMQPLKNLAAEEGTRVTFEGVVGGRPEPSIKWFKEGRPLGGSPDYEISFERGGRVRLVIPEVFDNNSGKYTCTASNKAGQVSSTAELVVRASMIPPQFSDRLQSKEAKEGETVRFTVRVSGKPPPTVTWYREGSKIVSSADFQILQEGELHSLYIPEVFYEDSGKFSVKAENRGGVAQYHEVRRLGPGLIGRALPPTDRLRFQAPAENQHRLLSLRNSPGHSSIREFARDSR